MELGSDEAHISSYNGRGDSKANPVSRRITGRWKATVFLFVYEAWERMAWLMMASTVVDYLHSDMNESSKTVTRNVNNWVAVSYITSIIGGYLADAYLSFFRTIWVFSTIYILGFLMMALSASIPSLHPSICEKTACVTNPSSLAVVFFYLGLYLLTVGTGGVWPAIPAFGADQFDDRILSEQISRNSFFNWFFFSGAVGSLISWTLLVYARQHISVQWQFRFSTISTAVALAVFLFGAPFYRHKKTTGQPLTNLARVVVAAARNRNVLVPQDSSRLYQDNQIDDHRLAWNEENSPPVQPSSRKLYHSGSLRCLDKAAVIGTMRIVDGESRVPASKWSLCSVTQVEELKLILHIAPIWFFTLIFNVVKAQVPTFFVQQGQGMDRKVGKHGFSIPAVSMQAITSFVILLVIPGYDIILVPYVRRFTKNERGISLLQRIGIGMLFSILTVVAAALIETERRKQGSLSILWLCPQYVLEGLGEVFTSVGQLEFFYDQAPDPMRGMAAALYFTNYGVALFLSNLLLTIVNNVTSRNVRTGWVDASHINRERLDLYYWVLAVLGSVNFIFYMTFVRCYEYKRVDKRDISKDSRSFEWNVSELGLMQKPTLFRHMSTLKAVKEEEHTSDESPQRTSSYTSETSPG